MHLKTVVKVVVVVVVVCGGVVVGGDGCGSTGRCRWRTRSRHGGGGSRGGLNALHQPRHPKIAHGILELLAIHVTFELLGLLLDTGSPIILYLIIGSSRQILSNFRPSDQINITKSQSGNLD